METTREEIIDGLIKHNGWLDEERIFNFIVENNITRAKTVGGDKAPLNARIHQGTLDNESIKELDYEIALLQDDPASFLALSEELLSIKDFGTEAVVYTPFAMDGSTNAFQHQCITTWDELTASRVNMTQLDLDDQPDDMYGFIGTEVELRIACREGVAEEHFELAKIWAGNDLHGNKILNRSNAKKIVMTVGYGLSVGGAKNYVREIIEECMSDENGTMFDHLDYVETDKETGEVTVYIGKIEAETFLAQQLMKAISEKCPSIANSRDAIQKLAEVKAKLQVVQNYRGSEIVTGLPMSWNTGLGFNAKYLNYDVERAKVKISDSKSMIINKYSGLIDPKKMKNASSPNYTHSRDAEHLQRYVNAMGSDFLMIHDSFGSRSCDAPRAYEVIRSTFIEQYKDTDPLADLFLENTEEIFEIFEDQFYEIGITEHKELLNIHLQNIKQKSKTKKTKKEPVKVKSQETAFSSFDDLNFDDLVIETEQAEVKRAKRLSPLKHIEKLYKTEHGGIKQWPEELQEFRKCIKSLALVRELSQPTGTYDIDQVANAPYFFI